MTIYFCQECGAVMWEMKKGAKPSCCGQPMKKLEPNTTDAAIEKHIPVITKEDGKLTAFVGSAEHPMTEEHSILWLAAVGDDLVMKKDFKPGEKPTLTVCDRGFHSFYAYCNLHGLWKGEMK